MYVKFCELRIQRFYLSFKLHVINVISCNSPLHSQSYDSSFVNTDNPQQHIQNSVFNILKLY